MNQVKIYNPSNAHFEEGVVFHKHRGMILQGDIALLPIDAPVSISIGAAKRAHNQEVTLGAATGHPHIFRGTGMLYAVPAKEVYTPDSTFAVSILHCHSSDGRLVHTRPNGHVTHQVLEGWYEVILQNQIKGEVYTRVLD